MNVAANNIRLHATHHKQNFYYSITITLTDILAIAAHPDDIELYVSGSLMRTAEHGGSFAICDLTRGERGTRGSVETRNQETAAANKVLGIDASYRWNLAMPDGGIRISEESVLHLVQAIRYFRPRILLFPSASDRHPDHENAHRLAREAWFNAGLHAVETTYENQTQEPHRPDIQLTFCHVWEFEPDIIVDISNQFDRKLKAIAAYSSQFTFPGITATDNELDSQEPETLISGTDFTQYLIARMRRWGFMIGTEYGEGFQKLGSPIKLNDLQDLL